MLIDYEWAKLERRKKQKREAQRRYYARNAEKCRAMTKAWLEKNPDYQRQEGRDRYMLDPEKWKAKSRAYYAANRERINARRRAVRSISPVQADRSGRENSFPFLPRTEPHPPCGLASEVRHRSVPP